MLPNDLHTLRKTLSIFRTVSVFELQVKDCGPLILSFFALAEVGPVDHQQHVSQPTLKPLVKAK